MHDQQPKAKVRLSASHGLHIVFFLNCAPGSISSAPIECVHVPTLFTQNPQAVPGRVLEKSV